MTIPEYSDDTTEQFSAEVLRDMDCMLASLHTQEDIATIREAGINDACFVEAKSRLMALKYIEKCIRSGKEPNRDEIETKFKIENFPKSDDNPKRHAEEVVFAVAQIQADNILGKTREAVKGKDRKEFYDAIIEARSNLRTLAGPKTGVMADTLNGGLTMRYTGKGSLKKPPAQKWIVQGLVPDNWPTFFYGMGGSAKSYLAVLLALGVATGTQFLGTEAKSRKVLYLDWEMDEETFRGRVNRVAKGMKISLADGVPNLIYRRLLRPLKDYLEDIVEQVEAEGIGMVVIDSFGFSMTGMDTNKQPDVTAQMGRIAEIPAACVIIDHIAKEGKGELGPFGSIYKHAAARWMWWCRAASKEPSPDGEVKPGIFVRMWNAKHNIAAQQKDIYLHIKWDDEFDANKVTMKRVSKDKVPESLTEAIKETEEKGALGTTSRNVLRAIQDVPSGQVPDVKWIMSATNYTRVPVDKSIAKLETSGEIRSEMVQPIDANGKKEAWRYAYYPVAKTVPADKDVDVAKELRELGQ